jgi:hypothetical protein
MDEAVRTVASPAATWVIVSVMLVVTAFMVGAALVADWWQARDQERSRLPGATGVAAGVAGHGTAVGGAAAETPGVTRTAEPATAAEPTTATAAEPAAAESAAAAERAMAGYAIPGQRSGSAPGSGGRHRRPEAEPADAAAAGPDRPADRGAPGRHALPEQRGGGADRAERSSTGADTPDQRRTSER